MSISDFKLKKIPVGESLIETRPAPNTSIKASITSNVNLLRFSTLPP